MKKALVLLMLLGLVVGLVFAAGCGDDKKTIDTPFGEVTEEDGEITYESEEGDVTYDYSEDEAPSEDDLGVSVYPDAEFVPGTGVVVRSSGTNGEVSVSGAQFTTQDDFEDVVDFYTDELGEPFMVEETTTEATWISNLSDESIVTVTVTDGGSEVSINIGRLGGSE